MDYKDLGVVGLAILGGGAGGALAGPVGVVGGVVAGSAVGAKWASESDAVRELRERVDELEDGAAQDADTDDTEPVEDEALDPPEADREATAVDDEDPDTTTETGTETVYK